MKQPTSRAAYEAGLAWILRAEKGFVNNPRDPGGATNMGISLRTIVNLRDVDGQLQFDVDGDGDVDARDVELLAARPDLVEEHYHTEYWRPAGCDLIVWPHSLFVFDCAVHSGPRVAIVTAQRALRVSADGKVGPETATAAARMDPAEFAARFVAERVELFRAIVARRPDQAEFFRGWVARQVHLVAEAIIVRPR